MHRVRNGGLRALCSLRRLSTALPPPSPASGSKFNGCELTFLGASSQGCAHGISSALALRLRAYNGSQAWLFDAGEGALQQIQRSHLRVSQIRHIFITHLHADHVFGLPGIVMAALANTARRTGEPLSQEQAPIGAQVTVYGPPGIRAFLRATLGTTMPNFQDHNSLRIVELEMPAELNSRHRYRRAQPYWSTPQRHLPFETSPKPLKPLPVPGCPGDSMYYHLLGNPLPDDGSDTRFPGERSDSDTGSIARSDSPASVHAAFVAHSVPCVAYVITENPTRIRFEKEKLAEHGIPIDGRASHRDLFKQLLTGQSVQLDGKTIHLGDLTRSKSPSRRICVVGDTSDASGVAPLCRDVDVLVHEATMLAAETDIARSRGHSSSRTAAEFAKRIGARRTILNHVSVSYSSQQVRTLESEARALLGRDRAFVAHNMSIFNVPQHGVEDPEFIFRSNLGTPRHDRGDLSNGQSNAPVEYSRSRTTHLSDVDGETVDNEDDIDDDVDVSASSTNRRDASKMGGNYLASVGKMPNSSTSRPLSILERSPTDPAAVERIRPLRLEQVRW
jgi:ribonuclease Z